MFKNLLLIRHAKAFDNEPGQRDFDRELTPDGVKDASKIGKYLLEQNIKADLIRDFPEIERVEVKVPSTGDTGSDTVEGGRGGDLQYSTESPGHF